jgi:hypothetical protein
MGKAQSSKREIYASPRNQTHHPSYGLDTTLTELPQLLAHYWLGRTKMTRSYDHQLPDIVIKSFTCVMLRRHAQVRTKMCGNTVQMYIRYLGLHATILGMSSWNLHLQVITLLTVVSSVKCTHLNKIKDVMVFNFTSIIWNFLKSIHIWDSSPPS